MSNIDTSLLPPAFRDTLSEEDFQNNSTLQSFDQISEQLETVAEDRSRIDTILDVGCGSGGFAAALGKHLNAEIHGIDSDQSLRKRAKERGITMYDVDVRSEQLPLADNSVDLVVAFGLIEHLPYYTTFFEEVVRILDAGWFWIASPNLASWINRIALLFGYQPRNVEVSKDLAVGSLPMYDRDEFLNHVSAPTYRALIDLLHYHNLNPVSSVPLSPYQQSILNRTLDRVFNLRIGLARRVVILSHQKQLQS